MTYMTTAATYAIAPRAYGIRVEINKVLTGAVTIADGGTTVGIIAAATGAGGKVYYGFNGAVTVTNASAEDITVSVLNHQG